VPRGLLVQLVQMVLLEPLDLPELMVQRDLPDLPVQRETLVPMD